MTGPSWQAIAALVDPVRRALYECVRRRDHAVTREEAADAVGISRHLSAFHLDKLVEVGLLRARYEAPTDQPRGRGRTPKVYEPHGEGVAVVLPPRHYEVVGQILADAVAAAPDDAPAAVQRGAFQYGQHMGSAAREATPSRTPADTVVAALTGTGFEPRREPAGTIVLGNCPFRALAERQPELVCGLNLALVRGIIAGVGTDRLVAALEPRPGACCVAVHEAA